MNNLLSYCGLVDARISYSDEKDLAGLKLSREIGGVHTKMQMRMRL